MVQSFHPKSFAKTKIILAPLQFAFKVLLVQTPADLQYNHITAQASRLQFVLQKVY